MMADAVLGIFVASLLGSPHCTAMCGPFVAFYAGSSGGHARRGIHGAYNVGRLMAYVTLGFAAGSLGAGVDRIGPVAGLVRPAALIAGAMMIAWGLSTILALHGVPMRWLHGSRRLTRLMAAAGMRAGAWPPVARAWATGLMTALLPCGWLYAFVAVAAGSGGALRGALVMLIFWTGTLPAIVALGLGLQRLAGPLRARLPAVTAVAVVLLGLLTLSGRLNLAGMTQPAAAVAAQHGHP